MTDIFEKWKIFENEWMNQAGVKIGTISFFLSEINEKLEVLIDQLRPKEVRFDSALLDKYFPENHEDE